MVFSQHGTRAERRGHRRIRLRATFHVTGRDEQGSSFASQAETTNVCGEGGCLILDKDLKKETVLKLAHPSGRLFRATVRWSSYDSRKNARYVGFRLAQSPKGWILADSR